MAAGADEVDEDVLAQLVRSGEERATAVDLGHLLDEPAISQELCSSMKVLIVMPLAGAALDFLERLLEGALGSAGR